jgi:hypothetical protein
LRKVIKRFESREQTHSYQDTIRLQIQWIFY